MTTKEDDEGSAARPLSEEQKAKLAAETAQITAQTARDETKGQAEIDKLVADARRAKAEADAAEIGLKKYQRQEREEMAGDKYNRYYPFTTAVNESSVKACIDRLAMWDRTSDGNPLDIEICFSSNGGEVLQGLVLYDYIQGMKRKGHRITTSTLGYAASMAGILLQAGNVRKMGREAWILIHEISFGTGGKIGEIEDEVAFVKRIQNRVLDIFAARAAEAHEAHPDVCTEPVDKDRLKAGWERKDWWVDSAEALKWGIIDVVE